MVAEIILVVVFGVRIDHQGIQGDFLGDGILSYADYTAINLIEKVKKQNPAASDARLFT